MWDHSLALSRPSCSLTAQGEIEMDRERVARGGRCGMSRGNMGGGEGDMFTHL